MARAIAGSDLLGLMPATAYVVASNAPNTIKEAALAAQAHYGSLVQLCDGVADNVEIQAAIDALPTTGGQVVLSNGRFVLAQAININGSYIRLVGQGSGAEQATGKSTYLLSAGTTLYIGANDAGIKFVQEDGANVRRDYIANLGIKSTYATYGNSYGIVLDNAWEVNLDNIRITDVGQAAFYASPSTSHPFDVAYIRNCMAVNCGVGFYFNKGAQLHLLNCYTNANHTHGYIFTGVTDVRALFNTSDGDPSGGFYIGSDINPYDLTFIGNRAYGSAGIGFDIGFGANISGLIFVNNVGGASNVQDFRIIGAGGVLYHLIFSHNYASSGTIALTIVGTGQIQDALITENSLVGTVSNTFGGTKTRVTIARNKGYITENSGTATITAGLTSVNVTHSLATTPTRVILTPTTDTAGRRYWVSAKGTTTFTITIDSTHVSDIAFDWRAQIGEG